MSLKEQGRQLRAKFDEIVEGATESQNGGREISIGSYDNGYVWLKGEFSLKELKAIAAAWEEVYPDEEEVMRNRT